MAYCRPQDVEVVLLRDDRVDPVGAAFSYAIEADNGILATAEGSEGPEGTSVQRGSYQWVILQKYFVLYLWYCKKNKIFLIVKKLNL